jgi:GNAT superfamily N-acetyltransferase
MMITFQVESWEQYFGDPEREALWLQHYAEFEPVHQHRMPFGPDIEAYSELARQGKLQITTVRRDGRLIGYCLVVITRHIHYNVRCGMEDSYYLAKSERKGLIGYRLIGEATAAAKRAGCVRLYFMTKEFRPIEVLLDRLGFEKLDSVWGLWL